MRLLKSRRWRWVTLAAALMAIGVCSVHSPKRSRVVIRFRGEAGRAPKKYELNQTLRATRCIPLLSCKWSLWRGFTKEIAFVKKEIQATSEGLTLEFDTARIFSLGAYQLESITLVAQPGEDSAERHLLQLDRMVSRYTEKEGNRFEGNFHITDLGIPGYFRLMLPSDPPGGEVVIDFDPIVFTRFWELPKREQWMTFDTHCSPATSRLLLSVGAARTLKYRTEARPPLKPGQPPPAVEERAEVLMVDGVDLSGLLHERPSPKSWGRLKARSIYPDKVRLKHDPADRTITLEVTARPEKGDVIDREDLVLLVGTPSADGRYFGMDCVRVRMESKEQFNPILYTVYEDMPKRADWNFSGNRCSAEYGERLEVKPGEARQLRYRTTVMPPPKDWDRLPRPKGRAEVFLVDGATADKLDERPVPEEWEKLKQRAIRPEEVQLWHDPAKRTIGVKVKAKPQGDYAIVAGTPSTDGRFFGVDCVRLKLPESPPPAPKTEEEGR